MTIDKSRRVFFAFAMFAISSVALTPGAAVAKPTIRTDARNHEIQLRTPAAQSKRPANDPFASMLLG
jgi:hypothetical protein